MAPVVALAHRPVADAAHRQRPVELAGELQHAREHRVAADQLGRGLDQADVRVGVHPAHQLGHGAGGHQRVGVQHQHVAVGAAPPGDEVLDVAGLALHVAQAAPVEDVLAARHLLAEALPGVELGEPDVGVGRVAQHEQVAALALRQRLQPRPHRPQAGEDAVRVLVVDRHDERGPGRLRRQARRVGRRGHPAAVQEAQAEHGRPCRERPERLGEPEQEDREDGGVGEVEQVEAVHAQDLDEGRHTPGGGQQDEAEEGQPPASRLQREAGRGLRLGVSAVPDAARRPGGQEPAQGRGGEPPVHERAQGPARHGERTHGRDRGCGGIGLGGARRLVGDGAAGQPEGGERQHFGRARAALGGHLFEDARGQLVRGPGVEAGRLEIGPRPFPGERQAVLGVCRARRRRGRHGTTCLRLPVSGAQTLSNRKSQVSETGRPPCCNRQRSSATFPPRR